MIAEDILKSLLSNPKEAGRHFIADCIFDDCKKQGHFYINKGFNSKGVPNGFDCKKCGRSGSEVLFLKTIGRLDLLEGRQVDRKIIDITIGEKKETEEEEEEMTDIKMPIGYKPVSFDDTTNAVRNYLVNRNFQKQDFENYSPGITKLIKKYQDYVLIPVERDFTLKGFVGRYIGEDEDKERYKNSKKTKFSQLIFGIDEVSNKTKTGIFIEGIFDKVAVTTHLGLHDSHEIKAMSTFGKKISPVQFSMIKNTNIENVIILFDSRDAVVEMKIIGYRFKKHYNTLIGYTGVKDPGASSKSELINIFENLETVDKFFRSKVQIPKFK